MNYLLDKKTKRKKIFKISTLIVVFIILFYFRSGIFSSFSYISHVFFRPVLVVGNGVGGKFKNIISYFSFKNSLYVQNQNLQMQVKTNDARNANYDSVVAENLNLKEILGRKNIKSPMVLGTILSKMNQSIYDTLIIDVGSEEGINAGDIVFAFGSVPIGHIDITYDHSSKVVLFSNTAEKTQAVISGTNIFVEIVGRGGGNFEMILPRDISLQKGDQIVMPNINTYLLAIVETTLSDTRDSFTKVLLVSPVNVQELRFVEVEIQK